jgi:L-threonylcarbamoyladenylate synthase
MKTKILQLTDKNIKKASKELKRGGLIGMPTETVYGLSANAFNTKAVAKIFTAKNRPQDNPLIVHVHKNYDLLNLVAELTENAKKLKDAFMPGPLTLVVKSRGNLSELVSRGLDTIAVRMPDHEVAEKLLRQCNLPLCAPSANISTRMSATTAKAVKEELNGKLKWILDGGTSDVGIESTVVDVTGEIPVILRPGKISVRDIKKVCGAVEEVKKLKEHEKVASPGMKYKHYSPNCQVELVKDIEKQYALSLLNGFKPVVLGLSEYVNKLGNKNTLSLGDTLEEYAKNLYSTLRRAEKKYDHIFIYKVRAVGLGSAIMNRVNKMTK